MLPENTSAGISRMINIRNYRDRSVTQRKDLVPTLEELKKEMQQQ